LLATQILSHVKQEMLEIVMAAFEDAAGLVQHAERELPKIRQAYEASLHAKTVSQTLLIGIKNFIENLRSALDFATHGVFDRYGSSLKAKPKIYFPYARADETRAVFEKSERIEARIPGLTASRPDIVQLLLEMQHFGSYGYTWLPAFMELTNENKHQRLTPQIRKETKELRISGGGASISLGQGASSSFGSGASLVIGNALIRGEQSFDVTQPPRVQGGKAEVTTWVSFHFDTNNQRVTATASLAPASTIGRAIPDFLPPRGSRCRRAVGSANGVLGAPARRRRAACARARGCRP
jgi:hypothetical protein